METFPILAARSAVRIEDLAQRLTEIDLLEECRFEALEHTKVIQRNRKEQFDQRLPRSNVITKASLVLLYDSRHRDYPSKLQMRWLGPYLVCRVYENGSLQVEDLSGQLLDIRVNGSRVKLYNPDKAFANVRGDAHR